MTTTIVQTVPQQVLVDQTISTDTTQAVQQQKLVDHTVTTAAVQIVQHQVLVNHDIATVASQTTQAQTVVGIPGPSGGSIDVIGPQGIQGIQGVTGSQGTVGTTGAQGTQGIQGTAGVDGVNGDAFIYADFTEGQLAALVGPQGEQGIQGNAGAAGQNGAAGAAGAKGDTGTAGSTGAAGTDGADGYTPLKGTDYFDGAKGDTGSTGAAGAAGAKGDTGLTGAAGADSTVAGPQGDPFIYTDFTEGQLAALVGADGAAGAKGDTGTTGATGAAGAKGDTGTTGAAGADSTVAGPTGPKGDTGDTGAAGTTTWAGITDKPATFTPAAHNQNLSTITDVTATVAEVNVLDGITATVAELNIMDTVTATAAELNALDGITATVTELNYTDGVVSAIQTQLDDKALLGRFSRFAVIESDCLNIGNSFAPLTGGGVASGTQIAGVATANHPGVVIWKSSATANSGWTVATASTYVQTLLGGGETYEVIFKVETTTNTTVRLGYHDTNLVTAPVDGVYLQIVGTTLTGVAMSNSSKTDTADTVTITQGVWYRAKLVLNADAALATFTLFTCADGQPVEWTQNTVASNIPTGAGRFCVPDMIATNSGTTAVNLLSLDWYRYSIDRVLVR